MENFQLASNNVFAQTPKEPKVVALSFLLEISLPSSFLIPFFLRHKAKQGGLSSTHAHISPVNFPCQHENTSFIILEGTQTT